MTETPVGKGRPTPKRSEAQRRRGGPPVAPPKDRKEAARRARAEAAAARKQVRTRAQAGDERYMTKRDRGPARAAVRDVVDGKRSVAVILLPLALLLVVAQMSGNLRVLDIALTVWLAGLLAAVLDTVLTAFLIRKAVRAAAPDEGRLAAHIGYGLLRSTVLRRFRLPAPRVSPGSR